MTTINDVRFAYAEAQGRWAGCHWPTHYGSLGLDLDGVSSKQAHHVAGHWQAVAADSAAGDEVTTDDETSLVDMALHLRLGRGTVCVGAGPHDGLMVCGCPAIRFCAESLAREWEFAACWLEEIESDARWAKAEAQEAVRAAEEGDWVHALGHAHQACSIEYGYDAACLWAPLERAIEIAAR